MTSDHSAIAKPRFSVRRDPDPLPENSGPIELTIRTPGHPTDIHHLSAAEAVDLGRRLVGMVLPKEQIQIRGDSGRPARLRIPLEMAGKWIAMDLEKTKILAHADTFQEVREMVGNGEDVVLMRVPDRRRWVPNQTIVGPPYARPAVPGALAEALDAAREAFADVSDEEIDRALADDPSPMTLAAERDSALVELAEARRLLAMATAFDAGPLLGGCSFHWVTGALRGADDSTPVRITRWPVDPPCWVVGFGSLTTLGIDGGWMAGSTEAIRHLCGFPSPAAALAALDAWRAARRAEIEGRADGGSAEAGGLVAHEGREVSP